MRKIDPRARSHLQQSVKLFDGFSSQVHIFYEAETVVSRIEHIDPTIRIAFHSLENYINALTVQADRIFQDQETGPDLIDRSEQTGDNEAQLAGELYIAMIFIDLHFYFICLDKVEKLFRLSLDTLAKIARGATDADSVRAKRRLADEALSRATQDCDTARNFHEHLDKEIAKGRHAGFSARPIHLGVELTFGTPLGAHSIEVGNLQPVYTAYERLIEYANWLPA
jgi:hypothetical protein